MRHLLTLLMLALVLLVCGCRKETNVAAKAPIPSSKPVDYFPTAVGTTWTYKITLGKKDALFARRTTWPISEKRAMSQETRGRFLARKEKSSYLLTIQVKARATQQGPLKYPNGVELTVVKDELGVYRDVKKLFWAITTASRFEVMEVKTYDMYGIGAPTGSWGSPLCSSDGSSLRLIFFGDRAGISIGLGDEPLDYLLSLGLGSRGLHFQRETVASKSEKAAKGTIDTFGQAFTEDSYFKEGIGLNMLKQEIDSETTMTWTLEKFTPGK